ncbi:D-alanyl-D-alanine endopeptidase [Leifsonia xyli subsp. cynodontis DSM 46306]|uniref:Peptidase S11 D-alanyl-D-alanine carboxypeptidase A N-terminal domain-containing protein n=1 Tax=Leifsonia xyli subsp. cynodontis DSM 46306 TaxID=1389489 RepID=U3P7G2_LEIXC|nr:D-alanyl-D-alanine carboxypeptidase [Leifsonia xyli]AGW41379.1 D-alanyl-D-alanine endopeptidase [Leifsonia xyli subsp. cynodontis DSM 46306]
MSPQVPVDPSRRSTRRQIYRRRRIAVFGGGGALLSVLLYLFGSLIAPVPATAAVVEPQQALTEPAAQLVWPGYGSAAIAAPGYPGATASDGSDASLPIASITKTITALVVLEKRPLGGSEQGPEISFTQKDVDIWNQVVGEGGSWAPVKAGTSMTEKEALTAMLLPSANNYAISLANWAFGSTGAYVSAANDWLGKEGFSGTKITSPDGLDPGNVSTTKDLIGIGKLVLDSPALSSIVSQKTATLPGAGDQDNTNSLLGIEGVDGIKTGSTDEAGFCLLFSAEVPVGMVTVRVLGAVLGADSRDTLWAGVEGLLRSMRDGFHEVEAVRAGQVFGSYDTPWGAGSDLVATSGKTFVVWSDTLVRVHLETRPLRSGSRGDLLGRVTFTFSGKSETVELALARDVPGPGFGWRIAHPGGFGA